MFNNRSLFKQMRDLDSTETITLGDGGINLEVKSVETVELEMLLPVKGSHLLKATEDEEALEQKHL